MLHDLGHTLLNGGGIDTVGKLCSHREAALTTAVHDASLGPLRTNLSNLAQGHGGVAAPSCSGPYHGHGRGDAQIGNVAVGHVRRILDDDGQLVVMLPYLAHAQVVGGSSKSQRRRCAGNA